MSSNNERRLNAISAFNKHQLDRDFDELQDSIGDTYQESVRQANIKQAIEEIDIPELNAFLSQENVHPHLDRLGVHKANHRAILGLAIREFEIPRQGRKFGHTLVLAYISPISLANEDLIQEAVAEYGKFSDKGIREEELSRPEPITGLVLVKKLGTIRVKGESGGTTKEEKGEVIVPDNFEREGVFDTALTSEISISDIQNWVDERFKIFSECLESLSE